MLRFVASGPFPAATDMGSGGAILGLVVHFALMAIMAIVLRPPRRAAGRRCSTRRCAPALAYGVVTYFAMNWLVVPLRFHTPLPPKPHVDRDPGCSRTSCWLGIAVGLRRARATCRPAR